MPRGVHGVMPRGVHGILPLGVCAVGDAAPPSAQGWWGVGKQPRRAVTRACSAAAGCCGSAAAGAVPYVRAAQVSGGCAAADGDGGDAATRGVRVVPAAACAGL
eukprot:3841032-Prymnesium_polylepis.1